MKPIRTFIFIIILTVISALIALPDQVPVRFSILGRQVDTTFGAPKPAVTLFGRTFAPDWQLKQGLDIQGGMQVVLQADMSDIPSSDRTTALESAREIIARRVDLFGVNEPAIRTAQQGDEYRIIVELAGVTDSSQALQLVGQTAELEFRLQSSVAAQALDTASPSAVTMLEMFQPTGLTGRQLKRASVQFSPQTNSPEIGLEFNDEGRELFGQLTSQNVGKILAIFIDDFPITLPVINAGIFDGQAVLTGGFTLDQAKQLAIQLNAGALPVPVTVLEQRSIGASLGQASVQDSIRAGLVGLSLVIAFMIALYGYRGFLAALGLTIYAIITIAVYKVLGVTLTLPGIAGLILSVGMAVDANILIFERMKEELRSGREFSQALELGFGRAWDSIKDANVATILTALILINPLNLTFLNTSGLVRGFGITLLIGVVISLFTGLVVTRTLMRLFLQAPRSTATVEKPSTATGRSRHV